MTFPRSTEETQVRALMQRKGDVVLTAQQELFVKEYLIDLNATQAAIRAGYPPTTATNTATKMMKRGAVKDAIARAMAVRSRRTGINADRVLFELGRIIHTDGRNVFREDGSLKSPTEMDADDATAIEGVKTRRIVEMGGDGEMHQAEVQEVRLASKLTAIGLAMRHLGMFNDKLDVNVRGLDERLNEAFKRTGMNITREVVDLEPEDVEEVAPEDAPEISPDQAEIERRLLHFEQVIEQPPPPLEPRMPAAEEYDMDFMLGLKASPG